MTQLEFAAIYALGGVVAFVMALVVWQRQAAPGALPFSLLMLGIAWWEITSAFEMIAEGISAHVFWTQLGYFGVAAVPFFWFLFAAQYSGKLQWLARRNVILAAFPALVTLLAAFTNEWHHLFWTTIAPSPTPEASPIFTHGSLFWLVVIGNYALTLAGTALLVRVVLRSHKLYRRQVIVMLVGVLIPWAANALYLSGMFSLRNADLTPLALTLTGVIWVASIYGNRLFDLVPVARDLLVEQMNDGVIVLDAQNRIVDVNRAALEILGVKDRRWIGQPAEHVLGKLAAWTTVANDSLQGDAELTSADGSSRYLNIRLSPLSAYRKHSGRLLILQDITERKRDEHALHAMNRQLQKQLEEIKILQATLQDQATRDPLTGLYNRRFLREILLKELAQAARTLRPLSLIVLDVDHFKSFNDTYGHLAGDIMLKAMANWLCTKTRRGDLICRYGGEEFIILLPGTSLETSTQRAQEWCEGIRELHIWHEDMLLHTTLSLGVAASPLHGTTPDELLHAADMAMYAAKEAGRDCVRVAEEPAQFVLPSLAQELL